jgi:tripeptidyl-peptidase-1
MSLGEINEIIFSDDMLSRKNRIMSFLNGQNNIDIVHDWGDVIVTSSNGQCKSQLTNTLKNDDISNDILYIGGMPSKKKFDRRGKKSTNIVRKNQTIVLDDNYVGREVIEMLYDIRNYTANGESVCSMEFDASGFDNEDLIAYQKGNGLKSAKIPQKNIVGLVKGVDVESQLDVQMVGNIGNADMWYWNVDGWIYDFAVTFVNSNNTNPNVISISYGWAEDDQCEVTDCNNGMTSQDYIKRCNAELMKIGLLGISVTVASGDAGPSGRSAEDCSSINPVFPGSSPWVTSVGAIAVVEDNKMTCNYTSNMCSNDGCTCSYDVIPTVYNLTGWTTGGGFGMYSCEDVPKWQQKETEHYLKNTKLPSSPFNKTGRGYPDIALVGHNCAVYSGGSPQTVDGTSCSTPIWGSLLALLNKYQVSKGRPRVGFFNPMMYEINRLNPKAFNDVTTGHNCGTENASCDDFDVCFVANTGWDPVTGLGQPNITEIMNTMDKLFSTNLR